MKFFNIDLLLISLFFFTTLSCKSEANKNEIKSENKDTEFLIEAQQNDSLYTALVSKVDMDKDYMPAIRFLSDSVIIQYFDTVNCYDCIENEEFIHAPMDYLEKIEIGDRTLVIARLSVKQKAFYFLLDSEKKIIDRLSLSTYRKSVLVREIYDWNKDGSKDIVEKYRSQGQMFTTYTDIIYSIKNDQINLIFSLDYKEVDCSTTDNLKGKFIERKYENNNNHTFVITEKEGYCSCENISDEELKNIEIISEKTYSETISNLLAKYGEDFTN